MTGGGPSAAPHGEAGLELWLVALDDLAAALEAAAARCGIAASARQPDDRRRRTAELALRLLLARRIGAGAAGAPFRYAAHGKPALASAACDFSLSHSGGMALIGLRSAGPIGVDLELPRRMSMAPARRDAIARAAVAVAGGVPLPGATDEQRSLAAWVRLEAAAKATGEGIGRLLTRLHARPGMPPPEAPGPLPLAIDLALPEPLLGAVAAAPGLGWPPAACEVRRLTAAELA